MIPNPANGQWLSAATRFMAEILPAPKAAKNLTVFTTLKRPSPGGFARMITDVQNWLIGAAPNYAGSSTAISKIRPPPPRFLCDKGRAAANNNPAVAGATPPQPSPIPSPEPAKPHISSPAHPWRFPSQSDANDKESETFHVQSINNAITLVCAILTFSAFAANPQAQIAKPTCRTMAWNRRHNEP